MPGMVLGITAILIGGYGSARCKRNKSITYASAQGDINIQLKPVRKTLLKVMRKMPEVYSIDLDVKPDKQKKNASIIADVVLKNSTAMGANRVAKMMADYLAATAREVLAVENLSAVRVNIKGIRVNAKKAGCAMREHLAAKAEGAEAYAPHGTAQATPPAAPSTDNHSAESLTAAAGGADREDAITAEEEDQLTRLPDVGYQVPLATTETVGVLVDSGKDETLPPLLDDNDALNAALDSPDDEGTRDTTTGNGPEETGPDKDPDARWS